MATMSATRAGTVWRMRRMGVIAGLIVVAGTLAGCSSSADSANGDAAAYGDAAQQDSRVGAVAPEADAGAVAADRSVIVTGAVYMTVEDPIAAADKVVVIVRQAGGRIDARSETAPDERGGGSATLTLRIPANDLDAVVADLRTVGTVDQFATSSYDVTTEVTDLEAQISTLRASTDRIKALLVEAKDISDIITLENELDGRQARLESLEARQRGLDDQVSMSRIDLSLTTEPVVIVDDAPESFWDGLVSGWNSLVAFLSGTLVVVGVVLPWTALAALIVLASIVAVRARRSRVARRDAALAATPAAPQPPVPESSTSQDA